ncbi:MAG: hypothetical protein AAB911_01850 [Patescibacteria group bacterium]
MKNLDEKLKNLVSLDQKINKLPPLSAVEEQTVESEQRFEATYYSNKLEGNKLSKDEARKIISSGN